MSPNLKEINSKLNSREKRTHQNVPRVPKELHELRKATRELEAQVKQLTAQSAELKRQTAELQAGRGIAKPAPAKKEVASRGSSEPEVTRLVVAAQREQKVRFRRPVS